MTGESTDEPNSPLRRAWRRLHQFANRLNDGDELLVVCADAFFQFSEFSRQLGMHRQRASQSNKSTHDLDVHTNRSGAVKDAGKHGNVLFGEHQWLIATAPMHT